MDAPLTKAERLAIGGAVAPIVRRAADAPRRVTVVGKDGKPVGETTSVEVAKAVLARSEIEFSVQPGKRPEFADCADCGSPYSMPVRGPVSKYCPRCRDAKSVMRVDLDPAGIAAVAGWVEEVSAIMSARVGKPVRVSRGFAVKFVLFRAAKGVVVHLTPEDRERLNVVATGVGLAPGAAMAQLVQNADTESMMVKPQ